MEKEQATELEFLKYFYNAVDYALGPASSDIYMMLKEDFESITGKKLPVGYEIEEDE